MNNLDKKPPIIPPVSNKKPNEGGQFYFSGFVKITEVDTGKVLLQQRCN